MAENIPNIADLKLDDGKELDIRKPFILTKNGDEYTSNSDISTFKYKEVRIHMDNCKCKFIKYPLFEKYFRVVPFVSYDNKNKDISECLYVPAEVNEESFQTNPLLYEIVKNMDICMCYSQLFNSNPNGGAIIFGDKEQLELICEERQILYNNLIALDEKMLDDVAVQLYHCEFNKKGLMELEKELSQKYDKIKRQYFVNEFFENPHMFKQIKNKENKNVLLLLIKDKDYYEISFAQGKRNFGEHWIKAAQRECAEESLLYINDLLYEQSTKIMTSTMGFCVINFPEKYYSYFDAGYLQLG
jgi:hypothetical protein